jgi:aryl sulfotransferase
MRLTSGLPRRNGMALRIQSLPSGDPKRVMTKPMKHAAAAWPKKTRELHNHHLDSTMWNGFRFRDGDIVIATYAKAGTTWMQQIVAELLFNGAEGLDLQAMSPWIDFRVPSRKAKLKIVEAQDHRRFVKTHLPVDALPFSPRAKYIYIGRDGRDVLWSLYNHYTNGNADMYRLVNETPGRIGPALERPPSCPRQYFRDWLEGDGYPFWSFWENVRSWWEVRELPNVLMVHFASLKRDLPGEIRRIACFLDIPIDASRFPMILEHCSFDYMKRNARWVAPLGGAVWEGGAGTFIHKGTNGRWRDVLSAEESAAYNERARAELGPLCAAWLAAR